MIRAGYALITDLSGLTLRLWLAGRQQKGKEDPARRGERFGVAGRPRPEGPLVWVHGASVGESLSALPLIERMLAHDPALRVLVTTGTVTSAALMATRLPERAFHQYIPVDRRAWVRRFLDHWRPDAALWMESELWPNLVTATVQRSIPLALINARMSERSFRRWRRVPAFARALLSPFAACVAQSEADADRFRKLGADPVVCSGNLKFAAGPLPVEPQALDDARAKIGNRPVWLAASTHPGEETMIARAHERLRRRHPELLTIIVPRHPIRGPAIAREIDARSLTVARRGNREAVGGNIDVYLADTMGELGLFYRLTGIAFVGGSLVPHGGQNPLEPAQLDCAIVTGPHMENFAVIADALAEAGASDVVADADGLAEAVDRLLGDAGDRDLRAKAAQGVVRGQHVVLDRTFAAIEAILPPVMHAPKPENGGDPLAPPDRPARPGQRRARA